MIDLTPTLNVEVDILQWILDRRKRQDIKGSNDVKFKLLGQEKDGTLLYCWIDIVPELEEEGPVVHIGTYDPSSKYNKLVFMHDKNVNIVNCTINLEKTFLGFVTQEYDSADGTGSPTQRPREIYKAFIAEIQPQERVFYLNIERPNALKLQFLYTKYRGQVDRESHMLVILHKESIGLYHIPISKMGDKAVILGGQPRKQQVTNKKFTWCQFDQQNQRLYVIYHRKSPNQTGGSQYDPVLASFQFTGQANIEVMVELPLEVPVSYSRSSSRSSYLNLPLCSGIPDSSVNIEVVSQSNGTLCVCYQHPLPATPRTSAPLQEFEGALAEELIELKYSVCIIHLGKTLNCSVPKFPRSIAKKSRIHFSVLNDYVLVYLPNYFVHLLNIGIEFEPCHHILNHAIPRHPTQTPTNRSVHLSSFCKDRTKSRSDIGACFYDNASQIAYKMTLNKDGLVNMFRKSVSSSTRLAILHYAVVHNKELPFIKQLFEVMACDVTNSEIPALLEEFLIGYSYSAMRKQLDRDTMRLLPFTTSETGRGQNEKMSSGERVAQISYTPIKQAFTLLTKKLKFTSGDLWDSVCRRLRTVQTEPLQRFNNRSVYNQLLEMEQEEKAPTGSKESSSFFKKLSAAAKIAFGPRPDKKDRPPSRSEQILGTMPHFMDEKEADLKQERIAALTKDRLTQHLCHYLKSDSIQKIQNMSTEYISCQIHQSRLLCHMIWSVMACNQDQYIPLNVPSTQSDYELFQLMERYYLVVIETAFPLPPGFDAFFAALGFRCLDFRLFIQYVDRDVLRLTADFIRQVLEDLEDTPSNVRIKYQLITKLPKEQAMGCFQHWGNKISIKYRANQYVQNILKQVPGASFPEASLPDSTSMGASASLSGSRTATPTNLPFPPLSTFLKLLEQKDPKLISRDAQRITGMDSRFIEEAALLDSKDSLTQQAYIKSGF
ncbi:unnamed protein product [Owenia fusiformis]|uniref:Uncharacterized protein n=1 Tax=Owenia fusiformis TaxID=6347 RepID=A0A8J1T4X2_OWEFU|nr:unnamed protein product [Owenia fusiformis]